MSVFDCHVNRAPVSGRVERIVYTAGKFLNADLDKASEDNERNALVLVADAGRVGVVQIAGLILEDTSHDLRGTCTLCRSRRWYCVPVAANQGSSARRCRGDPGADRCGRCAGSGRAWSEPCKG
jgi:phosphatidylserine decarboxylase